MCEDSLTNRVLEMRGGADSGVPDPHRVRIGSQTGGGVAGVVGFGAPDPRCVRIRSQTGRLRCGEAPVSGDRSPPYEDCPQAGAPRSFPPIGPPHLPSDNNAEELFARVDSRAKSPSNSAIRRKRDYPNWRTIPALLHDCTSTPSARLHLTLTSSPVPTPCRKPAQ